MMRNFIFFRSLYPEGKFLDNWARTHLSVRMFYILRDACDTVGKPYEWGRFPSCGTGVFSVLYLFQ